ncbi:SMP-30/gluconolactonase/LRE family protein [Pseudonocardia sp. RS010]|uniref:SMP-30/gluconolactonase/LRE family protein n=1 Tax=Pseudonocardia sp. RS010 TaxID=3385979 RepID=UPI0039A18AE6
MMPEVLCDGLVFGEGPRWHDGRLWLSDQHDHKIWQVTAEGERSLFAEFDDMPSGLGFLADGTVLVAMIRTEQVLALSPDGRSRRVHSDLSAVLPGTGHVNDMVVDPLGRAYVGVRRDGYADFAGTGPDGIALVAPDASATLVEPDFRLANGLAVTADGSTLISGSTASGQLGAWSIAADGTLGPRRLFAQTSGPADGICLDEAGGVWVGHPHDGCFERVLEGGEVTDRIDVDGWAIACVLGGPDRRRLHLVVTDMGDEDIANLQDPAYDLKSRARSRVEVVDVEHAGAGSP